MSENIYADNEVEEVANESVVDGSESADADAAGSNETAKPAKEVVEYVNDDYDASAVFEDKSKVDANQLAEYSALAKELKLTKTQADTLAKSMHGKIKESYNAGISKVSAEWAEAVKADEELKDLPSTVKYAQKAIDKYGTPALREIMVNSPFGNNPEVLRLLTRVGKALSEPSIASAPPQKAYTAKDFYSKSNLKD